MRRDPPRPLLDRGHRLGIVAQLPPESGLYLPRPLPHLSPVPRVRRLLDLLDLSSFLLALLLLSVLGSDLLEFGSLESGSGLDLSH